MSSSLQVTCVIEGYEKTLNLTLAGTCVDLPTPREVVYFECPVREVTKRDLQIMNP